MPETPVRDRLEAFIGPEALVTYRGQTAPEFDVLRVVPLRTRRRLTGARYMRSTGMPPDYFEDLLRANGAPVDGRNAISWFVAEAVRALNEVQAAKRVAHRRALAHCLGVESEYEVRLAHARAAGFESFWQYRKFREWG